MKCCRALSMLGTGHPSSPQVPPSLLEATQQPQAHLCVPLCSAYMLQIWGLHVPWSPEAPPTLGSHCLPVPSPSSALHPEHLLPRRFPRNAFSRNAALLPAPLTLPESTQEALPEACWHVSPSLSRGICCCVPASFQAHITLWGFTRPPAVCLPISVPSSLALGLNTLTRALLSLSEEL